MDVNADAPPSMVHPPQKDRPPISLDWDRTLDDQRRLRRCPVCGCEHLYMVRQVPQLTGFALLVLAALVALMLLNIGLKLVALVVFLVLAVLDLVVFLFAARRLVCYRCGSSFSRLPIHRDHPRWDKTVAERYG